MRTALLVLAAACSSRPVAPPTPVSMPEPAAKAPYPAGGTTAAPAGYQLTASKDATWKPHRCKPSVWPSFDPDDDSAPEPSAPEFGMVSEPPDPWGHEDKLAAINKARKDGGVCDTRHRDQLEGAILGMPAPKPDPTGVTAWDRKTPLEHAALVRAALALTPADEKRLAQNGFVVPERLAYRDYTTAYYDIHRGQLPVYVSADSILHAVFASHDELVGDLESSSLMAHLDKALGAMHCGLSLAAKSYPDDVANDVDLYLTVARSLLAGQAVPSELGKVDGMAVAIVDAIDQSKGLGTVELFGRVRAFDTGQFQPRGHYTRGALQQDFKVAMWLSRVELNLASRDSASSTPGGSADPRETPREAVVALALADLVETTRATTSLAAVDGAWSMLAGRRDDVSLDELRKLRAKAGIASLATPLATSAEKLRGAIGDGYARSINVHPTPGVNRLPVVATVIGPRLVPDTVALANVTRDRGADLRAAEVGFMLGHDRALAHVDPKLKPALDRARDSLIHAPLGDDLYSLWLEAIRGLAHRPQGALPSFTDTPAYQDLRLGSAIAAYGQLRHNHVLLAAQEVIAGGCEIPDGYVEPAVETYTALAEFARQGSATFRSLDPKSATRGAAYFTRLEKLMRVLIALSREELANRPLSAEAKRFLAMIVEMRRAEDQAYSTTFPVATWDGWYIDLFSRMDTAGKDAAFVADYASYNANGASGVHYLGARDPRLGVFVVDVGGKPRMMVGPVASAFEHTAPMAERIADMEARTVAGKAPWAASYTVPAAKAPGVFTVHFQRADAKSRMRDSSPPDTVMFDSRDELGEVTVEVLDHHFVKMGTYRTKVPAHEKTALPIPPQKRPVEALRITIGAFSDRIDLRLDGVGYGTYGSE